MIITLFTPTYNRAHLLFRLYNSILQQNFMDVEWLIVDDGSSDSTENVIQSFIEENKIIIHYFKKKNGGKHSAINFGLQKAKGELFFIIDSDDLLADNALKIVEKKYQSIKEDAKICGIIGLSQYINKKEIVGDCFLNNNWIVSFADVYLKYHLKGDKSVAFKTDILKKYLFPEEKGIRFVFEAVVWHEMSKKYNVLAVNEIIQLVEYQNFGMSNSSYKKWYVQSLAFSYYNLIINKTYSLIKYPHYFVWNYIHLGINTLLSGESYFKKLSLFGQLMYVVCFPRAFISYMNLKNKMDKNEENINYY